MGQLPGAGCPAQKNPNNLGEKNKKQYGSWLAQKVKYLLLTGLEWRTVNHGYLFFVSDLWPKTRNLLKEPPGENEVSGILNYISSSGSDEMIYLMTQIILVKPIYLKLRLSFI